MVIALFLISVQLSIMVLTVVIADNGTANCDFNSEDAEKTFCNWHLYSTNHFARWGRTLLTDVIPTTHTTEDDG